MNKAGRAGERRYICYAESQAYLPCSLVLTVGSAVTVLVPCTVKDKATKVHGNRLRLSISTPSGTSDQIVTDRFTSVYPRCVPNGDVYVFAGILY